MYRNDNTLVLERATSKMTGRECSFMIHVDDDGHPLFVIASNLAEEPIATAHGTVIRYLWDWGHYFRDLMHAVGYWREQVLGEGGHPPVECPKCGSADIEAGRMQADGPTAWSDVECRECGHVWQEVYQYAYCHKETV